MPTTHSYWWIIKHILIHTWSLNLMFLAKKTTNFWAVLYSQLDSDSQHFIMIYILLCLHVFFLLRLLTTFSCRVCVTMKSMREHIELYFVIWTNRHARIHKTPFFSLYVFFLSFLLFVFYWLSFYSILIISIALILMFIFLILVIVVIWMLDFLALHVRYLPDRMR